MIIRQFCTDRFTVTVEAQPDYDMDLSWDETGEVAQKIQSGFFQHFCVKASVVYRGHEIATDYLGGCIYEHPSDFMDHRGIRQKSRADKCNYGSYFSDMVSNVISEARKLLVSGPKLRAA